MPQFREHFATIIIPAITPAKSQMEPGLSLVAMSTRALLIHTKDKEAAIWNSPTRKLTRIRHLAGRLSTTAVRRQEAMLFILFFQKPGFSPGIRQFL